MKSVWRDQFGMILSDALLSCPACGAAVPPALAQRHADWHNGLADNGCDLLPPDGVALHNGHAIAPAEARDSGSEGTPS